MLKVKVYNQSGKATGETNLDSKIFGIEINEKLVHQALRTHLANRRVAIAHTKSRQDVRGGGKKPWRQKGTGRARHGSIRSPLWKGGGVTFGPKSNRNFSLKMNKKAKRKALLMTLSDKATEKKIIVVDKIEMSSIKTKELATIITKLPLKKKVLIVLPKTDSKIMKSAKNIKKLKIINASSLNIYGVLNTDSLLIFKDSLKVMSETYAK